MERYQKKKCKYQPNIHKNKLIVTPHRPSIGGKQIQGNVIHDILDSLFSKQEDGNQSDEEIAMQPLLHGKDSEKIFKAIE